MTAVESPTMTDLLPVRGGKRFTAHWTAVTTDFSRLAGYARVEDRTSTRRYAVSECPVSVGRCFVFTKLGVPAREQSSYVVECHEPGDEPRGKCECPSFQARKACVHLDLIATLLLNEWV